MRLALATLAVSLVASAASAQSFTDMVCARYDAPYGKAPSSSDVRALESAAHAVPTACPLHGQIVRRLEALRARPKPATTAAVVKKKEEDTADTGDDMNDNDVADTTARSAFTSGPFDPCSAAGIDAQDPTIPGDGPPADLPATKRSDLARRYTVRAAAFDKCHDTADAQQYFAAAVATDSESFIAVAGRARFELGQGDFKGAVTDETAAIALHDHAPSDVAVIAAYADRASAYEGLQMWAEAAGDLNTVVTRFNETNDGLAAPFDSYKERLAKADLRRGDEADAVSTLGHTQASFYDWEDWWLLGRVEADAKRWESALDRYGKALAAAPTDAEHAPQRAQIEVAIAKVYQGRGADGDVRLAWDSYKAAGSDDLGNREALAALHSLGEPLAPPTFTEPSVPPVPMPAGVTDLATDQPGPFCGQAEMNDYLDSVKAGSAAVNSDMQILGDYSTQLLSDRAEYDANKLLTYGEKIADLNDFDAELHRIADQSTALRRQGEALIAFFNRVSGESNLVVYCKNGVKP
jgi:tetratricopeptide (TPR) repeat protein